MPVDVMTCVHLSVSLRQNFAKSAGEPIFGFASKFARLASISGDRRKSFIDVLSLSIIFAGVPIGATMPAQNVACRIANPLSVVVGTLGNEALRSRRRRQAPLVFPL